jgi:hypothetical protein
MQSTVSTAGNSMATTSPETVDGQPGQSKRVTAGRPISRDGAMQPVDGHDRDARRRQMTSGDLSATIMMVALLACVAFMVWMIGR